MKVAGLGRGAESFLALPISLDKMGIKKAAVFPEPENHSRLAVKLQKEDMEDNGYQLTCLSTSNNIVALEDGWQTILLNRSGNIVSCQLHILQHSRMKSSVLEIANRSNTNTALLSDIKLGNSKDS